MFSPWAFTVDATARELLAAEGWQEPDGSELPTGGDLVRRYLEPLANLPALKPHIRFDARVRAISRRNRDKVKTAGRAELPFVLRVIHPAGEESEVEAEAVIDASGTWLSPNPLGADGWPALGEADAAAAIHYGIPDALGAERRNYGDKTVLVVGAGHSALNTLLDLAKLREIAPRTRILWGIRRGAAATAFGGGGNDQLPARGALGQAARRLVESKAVDVTTEFHIRRIERLAGAKLRVHAARDGKAMDLVVDRIVAATGFRPDLSFLREVRIDLDPALESVAALAPLIDPNVHSCGTVRPHGHRELTQPEPGLYIVGMKSYGRAPTFLTATGYEQVRSVVAAMAGDGEAADRVELKLPETGVCSAKPRLKVAAAPGSTTVVATPEPTAACCG
jgi:hypothetical protein